jgi:phosphoribosylamine--glycine ligase
MKILVISNEFAGASLCFRFAREAHQVCVLIEDDSLSSVLDGIVQKVKSLEAGLEWLGKDGLVVIDCVGYGQLQDDLRADGYAVVGGSAGGDRLEEDRPFCQRVMAEYGIPTLPTIHFPDAKTAIAYVRNHASSGPWVIKRNGHLDSLFCYVGQLP